MGSTGATTKAGGKTTVSGSGDGVIATGCRCSRCRVQPDWSGNRAQRRAAKKAGLPKPKATDDAP